LGIFVPLKQKKKSTDLNDLISWKWKENNMLSFLK
jgi:hypothetical protein